MTDAPLRDLRKGASSWGLTDQRLAIHRFRFRNLWGYRVSSRLPDLARPRLIRYPMVNNVTRNQPW